MALEIVTLLVVFLILAAEITWIAEPDMHPPHLGHLSALAPAFPPGSTGHAGDSDVGVDGIVHHAPGSRLIRRQRGQIGEIGAAAGCRRLMCALVAPFRRTTCSPACAMRTERRRQPTGASERHTV